MAKRKTKGAYMLSRFAGVSEAGAAREPAEPALSLSKGEILSEAKEPYG